MKIFVLSAALLGAATASKTAPDYTKQVGQTGKRPDCPYSDAGGWFWSNLENSKKRCDASNGCNVVVHYGGGEGNAHSYMFNCPDLNNISWINNGGSGYGRYDSEAWVCDDCFASALGWKTGVETGTFCAVGSTPLGNLGLDECKAACVADPDCGGISGDFDSPVKVCYTCSKNYNAVQYPSFNTYSYWGNMGENNKPDQYIEAMHDCNCGNRLGLQHGLTTIQECGAVCESTSGCQSFAMWRNRNSNNLCAIFDQACPATGSPRSDCADHTATVMGYFNRAFNWVTPAPTASPTTTPTAAPEPEPEPEAQQLSGSGGGVLTVSEGDAVYKKIGEIVYVSNAGARHSWEIHTGAEPAGLIFNDSLVTPDGTVFLVDAEHVTVELSDGSVYKFGHVCACSS